MRKVKGGYLILLVLIIILSTSFISLASSKEDFNEYGFRNEQLQAKLEKELEGIRLFSLSEDWKDFDRAYNISLARNGQ